MATSGRKKSGPKAVKRITRYEDGSSSPSKVQVTQPKYAGGTGRSASTVGPAWTSPFTGQKRTGFTYTPPKTDFSQISTRTPSKPYFDPSYVFPFASPARLPVTNTAWGMRKAISPGIAALSAINGTKKKGTSTKRAAS